MHSGSVSDLWPAGPPGLYGKLPCAGDFLSRRAPAAFVEPWDRWAQAGLNAAREVEGFRDAYLTGPLWRFAIEPGAGMECGWAGVLMPSLDKAGRLFPLTLVTALPDRADVLALSTFADKWFVHAENTCLALLEAETLDDGAERLDGLSAYAIPAAACAKVTALIGSGGATVMSATVETPPRQGGAARAAHVTARAQWEAETGGAPLGLWWTLGAETVPLTFHWLTDLPTAALFRTLFIGPDGEPAERPEAAHAE